MLFFSLVLTYHFKEFCKNLIGQVLCTKPEYIVYYPDHLMTLACNCILSSLPGLAQLLFKIDKERVWIQSCNRWKVNLIVNSSLFPFIIYFYKMHSIWDQKIIVSLQASIYHYHCRTVNLRKQPQSSWLKVHVELKFCSYSRWSCVYT